MTDFETITEIAQMYPNVKAVKAIEPDMDFIESNTLIRFKDGSKGNIFRLADRPGHEYSWRLRSATGAPMNSDDWVSSAAQAAVAMFKA